MNESTNNPTEFERGFAEAERQFGPEIEHLRKEFEYSHSKAESYRDAYKRLQEQVDDTEEYLKEQHAGTMDEETRELIVEVLRRLGRETTKEVEVTVTATWYGSIEVPLDFDGDDLVADMPWNSEPLVTLNNTTLDAILNIDETTIEIS